MLLDFLRVSKRRWPRAPKDLGVSALLIDGKTLGRPRASSDEVWGDRVWALVLAVIVIIIAFNGAQRIPDWLVRDGTYYDVWFDGDSPRATRQAMDRLADPRDRSIMHPLYSLAAYPLTNFLSFALVITKLSAVRLGVALTAGIWTAMLFYLFRFMGCRRLDAILFTVLGAVSASATFWYCVPESWPYSALTVLGPLLLVLLAEDRPLRARWYLVAGVASLSMTLSNWMLGLIIAAEKLNWRRAIWICLAAFGAVAMLCGISVLIFPTYKIDFPEYAHEYVLQTESGGPLHVLTSFFLHTMVMPAFRIIDGWDHPGVLRMTVQTMPPGSATLWGGVAVWVWAVLFGFGCIAARSLKRHRAFLRVIVGWIMWELALHMIYGGEETFLYSLHWLPCLLVLAAYGALTRLRPAVLALVGVLILCAGFNNRHQFYNAVKFVKQRDVVHGNFSSILPPEPPAPPRPDVSPRARRSRTPGARHPR